MLPERVPHPVKDFATAIDNGRRICQPRGYCGPFINGAVYDAFPDPTWNGIAECLHCRNTVNQAREEEKMRLALRGFRDVRRLAPPPVEPAASRLTASAAGSADGSA